MPKDSNAYLWAVLPNRAVIRGALSPLKTTRWKHTARLALAFVKLPPIERRATSFFRIAPFMVNLPIQPHGEGAQGAPSAPERRAMD